MTWNEADHPRHPAGSSKGGEFSRASGIEKRSKKLYDMAQAGGFSYKAVTHEIPKEGAIVSIFPELSEGIDADYFTPADLARYFIKNREVLRQPGNYAGAWKNEGRMYLDVSRIVKTHAEAAALCIKHDQKGFFDLKEGKEYITNPGAKSGGAAGP